MSSALQATLLRAREYAAGQGHREVLLEHLLLALSEDEDAGRVIEACRIDVGHLRNDVAGYLGSLEAGRGGQGPGQPSVSQQLTQILKYATLAAKQGRRPRIDGAIVLAALIGDGRSMAASFLKAQGLTFEATVRVLQQSIREGAGRPPPAVTGPPPVAVLPPPAVPEPPHAPAPGPAAGAEAILAAARERVTTRAGRPITGDAAASDAITGPPGGDVAGAEPEAVTPAHGPDPAVAVEFAPHRDTQRDAELEREPDLEPDLGSDLGPNASPARGAMPPAAPATPSHSDASAPPHTMPTPPAMAPPVHRAEAAPSGWAPPPLPSRPEPGTGMRPPLPPLAPLGTSGLHRPPPAPPPTVAPTLAPAGPAIVAAQQGRPAAPPWSAPVERRPGGEPPAGHWPGAGNAGPPSAPYQGHGPGNGQGPSPGQGPGQGPGPHPGAQRRDPRSPEPHMPPPGAGPAGGAYPGPPGGLPGQPRVPAIEPGQVTHAIPDRLRLGVPRTIDVHVARAPLAPVGPSMSRPAATRGDVVVARAITVRLRPAKGSFAIDQTSLETQWDKAADAGRMTSDGAVWRFTLHPLAAGAGELLLTVSARTIAADGMILDTALPDQAIRVRVGQDHLRRLKRWSGLLLAVAASVLAVEAGLQIAGINALKALRTLLHI